MNLNEILKKHKMWLNYEEGGERADLEGTNLEGVDLRGADLRGVDLRGADLEDADLEDVDLRGADLEDADLSNANLSYADLRGADLRSADLEDADLEGANLRGADLRGADLREANIKNIKTNMHTIGYHLACPEEGSFIGYKKTGKCIIKLLILEDAKRNSATTMKCRCDKAKVLDIENIETGEKVDKVYSDYDSKFIYKMGEIVSVDNFDDNRWNECSTGIHFFMNRENAINY